MTLSVILTALSGLVLGFGVLGVMLHRRKLAAMLGDAREASEKIIMDARQKANQMMEATLEEAKQEAKKQRQQFEQEAKKRRGEYQRLEQKNRDKEAALKSKNDALGVKEGELEEKAEHLVSEEKKYHKKLERLHQLIADNQKILEKTAGMSAEEAKHKLMESLEQQAHEEALEKLKEIEADLQQKAQHKAKHIIAFAVQRQASDYVGEATLTVVSLPNEDMKGRIIGREGRNIRAIEQATGVDLIIDDTPEAVILSCFHPVRREVAKITLERLMEDGRIHPARIEETVDKVTKEFNQSLKDFGEKAAIDVGIADLHPDLLSYLGHLKFCSFGKQSVLTHSVETAQLAGAIAAEIGFQPRLAKRTGLLHDIGKAVGQEIEGHHAVLGAKLCERHGENKLLVEAIRHHHDDDFVEAHPLTIVLHTANSISEARKGAREANIQKYVQRLEEMESVINQFDGVEKCYVFQAGREIRVMVNPDLVSDQNMNMLSRQMATKIKEDLTFPGRIRITLLRESKFVDYAK